MSLALIFSLMTASGATALEMPEVRFVEHASAVTEVDPLAIDLSMAKDSQDLAGLAPLTVVRRTAGYGDSLDITLRGGGGVRSLVDGIDIRQSNYFGLFDVEAVSVRPGPHGGQGGPMALGGVVETVLARPGDEVGGYLNVGWGRFSRWDLRASLDLPLSEDLAVKVSGYKQFDKGYVRNNVTGEKLGRDELSGLRFAARLTPAHNVEWNISAAYMAATGDNIFQADCDATGVTCGKRFSFTGASRRQRLGGSHQYILTPPAEISGRKSDFPLGSKRESLLLTSNLAWGGEGLNVQLLTGYLDGRQKGAMDFADGRIFPDPVIGLGTAARGAVNGGRMQLFDMREKQLSQEVRFAGDLALLRYHFGGYFSERRLSEDKAGWVSVFDATPDSSGVQEQLLFDGQQREKWTTRSGYLGFELDPTWTLTLAATMRYTSIKQDWGIGCGVACERSAKWSGWTPSFSVSWWPADGLMIYASARRGIEAPAILDEHMAKPRNASGWTYEAGVRQKLDTVTVALSAFHNRFNNMYVSGDAPDFWGANPWGHNVGDFRNIGAELRLEAEPAANIRLWGAAGVQDAKWRNVPAANIADHDACVTAGGGVSCFAGIIGPNGEVAKPAFAPDWTVRAGASYAFHIPYAGIFVEPVVDVDYRSSMALSPSNFEDLAGSRFLVNAGLGVRTNDGNWLLRFECANCFDKDYVDNAAYGLGYRGMPRTWMLQAKRAF